ncbi:MAG: RNA methyltransferase [Erysipelotrichaceae bacterium]|nr:RNA methyltransferase [Erysipelotrichaceae bacterium]
MKIESLTNSKVKRWMKLHSKKGRDEAKQFLVEEQHLIEESLANNSLETLLYVDKNVFDFKDSIQVSQAIMDKLSKHVSTIHYLGVVNKPNLQYTSNRILLLDGIQDPGNMGTILRTAVSFGFKKIYTSKDCVDVYNEKCIRATQGAIFKADIIVQDLNEVVKSLKEEGYILVGTSLKQAIPLKELKQQEKMAFIFGNEGNGVRDSLLKMTDCNVKIEMEAFESLNVAVAAGILMYECRG